jgi:fructose-1-phosphate kinase PfkB-like protein
MTVLESAGRETHFKETMPAPSRQEGRVLLRFLDGLHGQAMAVCGSAPPGTPRRLLQAIVRKLRERFKVLVVDSSGPLLVEAGRAGCDGLKGNADEIGAWLGLRGTWDPRKATHRRRLVGRLSARKDTSPNTILVTRGARGAVLAVREGLWCARPPRVARSDIISPTGCGDAATAGWLWAMAERVAPDDVLRRAVACGTAKLHSADPGALDVRTVRRLRADIKAWRTSL